MKARLFTEANEPKWTHSLEMRFISKQVENEPVRWFARIIRDPRTFPWNKESEDPRCWLRTSNNCALRVFQQVTAWLYHYSVIGQNPDSFEIVCPRKREVIVARRCPVGQPTTGSYEASARGWPGSPRTAGLPAGWTPSGTGLDSGSSLVRSTGNRPRLIKSSTIHWQIFKYFF